MENIHFFREPELINGVKEFFRQLKVNMDYVAERPFRPEDIFESVGFDKNKPSHARVEKVYIVGKISDDTLSGKNEEVDPDSLKNADYDFILVMAMELNAGQAPSRGDLSELTRMANKLYNTEARGIPVLVVYRYGEQVALANTERLIYKQGWRSGEKTGKVSMLKDISTERTHGAHLKLLTGLKIDNHRINTFNKLYQYWQGKLNLRILNEEFYADLQSWFYFATQKIKLHYHPEYIDEKENTKNFIVRLLARTMFCWFVKEKGLIRKELLELKDWEGNLYALTHDIENENFLQSNSYYRGILQNLFFNALNQKEKNKAEDFQWTEYWHGELPLSWFTKVPYLSASIFDKLEEDNAEKGIADETVNIPNYLFYGIEVETEVERGRGANRRTETEKIEHKGLNGILSSYKFTLDENTPFEEDIALDPEMLGLVFENLLAELDPNLEESTLKSIRKQTGSYYTPRKVIFEMVNDSLNIYLSKFISENYPKIKDVKTRVNSLVYYNTKGDSDHEFEGAVVDALDKFKVLDPACGSGAFPMGVLHRMVDILKLVDGNNESWIALKLKKVDKGQQEDFKKVLSAHLDDYGRKLGIIRDSIYGIDIQPLAVQITKLRFFISLLIDQKTSGEITPMPNIETKIICADSLRNIDPDLFTDDALEKLIDLRARYYRPEITRKERQKLAGEIADVLDEAFPSFSYQVTGKRIDGQNRELLLNWFAHGTLAAPFFNMDYFYPELKGSGGFDCVIGNPPYGGSKISEDVKTTLNIESKDPYGAFVARFLQRSTTGDPKYTPLKHGGVLAFIVSDTFMTIKSHLGLRKHLMQNYVHKMVRVHPDTFRATVNTVIMIVERNVKKEMDDNHICLMADLTNISIHDNFEHFVEVLDRTKGVDFDTTGKSVSNEEYAIYFYPQALIKNNSNLPFFVASPKLFALLNDIGPDLKKEMRQIGGKQVQVRTITMNDKEIEVVKLGDIAEVKQGLITGANELYIYQTRESRGTYRIIDEFQDKVLYPDEIQLIVTNDALRQEIVNNGISINDVSSPKYFGGRHIVPHDKGGESDSDDGWMPNYYTPSDYYIDWSEESVNRLISMTTRERNILLGKSGGDNKICSRFQNVEYYFKNGLTLSHTGVYSPTFRINNPTPFNCAGSCLFSDYNLFYLIAFLNSKFKYFSFKSFINHTVNASEDPIKDIQIPIQDELNDQLIEKVISIIEKQKQDSRYDYASHEQLDIDKLVYEAHGLNAEDIKEVEDWYARRYPKLSAAQKANLRALGKSDDYLSLYGLLD